MNIILGVIAAFGGGAFAAAIGGLPSFIMTGVFSVVGGAAGMAGAAGATGILVNYFAFGVFFGPHIAFTGGVAAAAYAKKKGISENGADIATACAGYNEPSVLAIGGIFGVIGFLLKTFVVDNLFAGTISARLITDGPGICVFVLGIVIRLVFGGKLGTGAFAPSKGKAFANTMFISFSYACIVAGLYVFAVASGVAVEDFGGMYHVVIFGLCAVGLIFAEFGQAFFGCHHICIIAAEATVQSYATTGNLFLALVIGIVFGMVAGLLCDMESNGINAGTDSHIDGPAFAIFIMTFVVNACFPAA